MSATTQPQSFSDLYIDLLQRVRQDRNATATAEQAKRYINTGLYDMHIGFSERFPWAERSAILITHPILTPTLNLGLPTLSTFTVGLETGAVGLTTATNPTTLNSYGQPNMRPGGNVRFPGQREWYELDYAIAGSIAWRSSYIGPNLATGSEFTYFENEYDLASDFARPVDITRFTVGPDPINLEGRTRFRQMVEGRYDLGRPTTATMIDRATPNRGTSTQAPTRRIQFWPIPDQAYQLKYDYVTRNLAVSTAGAVQEQLSADTDEPIVPIRYRHAIVLHALYHWYRDKKDDARSQEARGEYIDLLTRIAGDNEIGSPKAQITPRVRAYRMRARRPWRGGTGRFDIDGRFDRLEDL